MPSYRKKMDKNTHSLKALLEQANWSVEKLHVESGIPLWEITTLLDLGYSPKNMRSVEVYERLTATLKEHITTNQINDLAADLNLASDSIQEQVKQLKEHLELKEYIDVPKMFEQSKMLKNDHPINQIGISIDQGSASDDKIAELLADISILYRMMGGSGINFEPSGVHHIAVV